MIRSSIWGIDFLDTVKAFLMPYTKPCVSWKWGQAYVVSMKREINEGKMLSTLQFSKGIYKKEPTYLATLKIDEESKKVYAPKAIQELLEERHSRM